MKFWSLAAFFSAPAARPPCAAPAHMALPSAPPASSSSTTTLGLDAMDVDIIPQPQGTKHKLAEVYEQVDFLPRKYLRVQPKESRDTEPPQLRLIKAHRRAYWESVTPTSPAHLQALAETKTATRWWNTSSPLEEVFQFRGLISLGPVESLSEVLTPALLAAASPALPASVAPLVPVAPVTSRTPCASVTMTLPLRSRPISISANAYAPLASVSTPASVSLTSNSTHHPPSLAALAPGPAASVLAMVTATCTPASLISLAPLASPTSAASPSLEDLKHLFQKARKAGKAGKARDTSVTRPVRASRVTGVHVVTAAATAVTAAKVTKWSSGTRRPQAGTMAPIFSHSDKMKDMCAAFRAEHAMEVDVAPAEGEGSDFVGFGDEEGDDDDDDDEELEDAAEEAGQPQQPVVVMSQATAGVQSSSTTAAPSQQQVQHQQQQQHTAPATSSNLSTGDTQTLAPGLSSAEVAAAAALSAMTPEQRRAAVSALVDGAKDDADLARWFDDLL